MRESRRASTSSSEQEDVLLKTRYLTLLLVVACAGSGTTTTDPTTSSAPSSTAPASTTTAAAPTTTAAFPVTVTAANGEVTLSQRPEAIVSMSASATEMLFAIGAGDQVVAVDTTSNYPPEAPITDLSAFTPNAEAIASYAPDLVLISFDANELLASLNELAIPTLLLPAPATLDDVWAQFQTLGAATGHVEEAGGAVTEIEADLEEIIAGTPSASGLTYYYELDPTYFSLTSQTFVGSLIGELGLANIADAADPEGEAFGYPQLTAEYIITSDPDLIILADTLCCEQDAQAVAARPGWEELKAVTGGGVVELNDDVASRWGPRITDLLGAVAGKVNELVASS